jgi:hypothetical protein
MSDTSPEYIAKVLRAAPFADNDAGIPQMCDLIRDLQKERDELAAAIDSIETSNGLTDNGNLWRFWSKQAREIAGKLVAANERHKADLEAVEQARADGHAQGLRDAAASIPSQFDLIDREGDRQRILALLPAEPCDTKSAENVTQAGLCQSNAQQAIKPTPAPAGKKGGTE